MEAEQFDFSVVFPNIAAQLRSVLGNLHLAAAQLAPAIRREGDPALDSTASLLDQSYYRLLRLVNNLTAAGELGQDAPLPVRDRDLTETVRAVCAGAQGLFALKKVQLEFRSAADCHTCAFHQPSIELLLYQLLSNALTFTPAGGAVIPGKSTVILYAGAEKPNTMYTVPQLVGKTAAEANVAATNAGLLVRFSGATQTTSGNIRVLSQSLEAGQQVPAGTVITVQLGDANMTD